MGQLDEIPEIPAIAGASNEAGADRIYRRSGCCRAIRPVVRPPDAQHGADTPPRESRAGAAVLQPSAPETTAERFTLAIALIQTRLPGGTGVRLIVAVVDVQFSWEYAALARA